MQIQQAIDLNKIGVKLTRKDWPRGDYFSPFFKDTNDNWHGLAASGHQACYSDDDEWILLSEFPVYKTVYLWVFKSKISDRWKLSVQLMDEAEAGEALSEYSDYKKLNETAIQVEV